MKVRRKLEEIQILLLPPLTSIPKGEEAKVDGEINFPPQWAPSPSCFTTPTTLSGKLLNCPEGYCMALCSNKKQNEPKKKCCSGTGQRTKAAGTKQTFSGSCWKVTVWGQMKVRGHWCLFYYKESKFEAAYNMFISSKNNFLGSLNTHTQTHTVVKFGIWKFLLSVFFVCSHWVSLNLCSKTFFWTYLSYQVVEWEMAWPR